MKKLIAILSIVTVMMSSCAIHKGMMHNSVSLSSNNFTYVKRNISGSAQSLLVCGIGGFGKQSLIDEAKKKMLQDNPLQNNQSLANVTVNEKISVYAVVIIQQITVTADVVEFK